MNKTSKHVDILDTTLRDGSYTIGYQFSADETSLIAQGLELTGVDYIEVGHGLGLGADSAGMGDQAVTDIEYMRSCAKSLNKSKFGFFYIPKIGKIEDIKILAGEGGSFVRIGTTLESIDETLRTIEEAKKLGLEVWVNIMKTYVYPVVECALSSSKFVQEGAAGVYVVDSAGGMLPGDVTRYVSQIKESFDRANIDGRIGYHGHDNLSLATACSLSAIDSGCSIVDGSLMGIGRSAGNAATEILAMVLSKAGYTTGIDAWSAADLAEKTIKPFLERRWRNSSVEQALGYKEIHSGFFPLLEEVANEKELSVRDIILSLDNDAKNNMSKQSVLIAANEVIKSTKKSNVKLLDLDHLKYQLNDSSSCTKITDLNKYVNKLKSQSLRMPYPSAIVITGPWNKKSNKEIIYQQIRSVSNVVVGAIEIKNSDNLDYIMSCVDQHIDYVFLDKTPRSHDWVNAINNIELSKWGSHLLPYADEMVGLLGACHTVAIEANKRKTNRVEVIGDSSRKDTLKIILSHFGLRCTEKHKSSIIIIADETDDYKQILSPNCKLVYDLMSGTLNSRIAKELMENDIEIIRLDGHAALVREVSSIIDTYNYMDQNMGKGHIDSVPIVAGGVWGSEGDVVVDAINDPIHIIGVADGNGHILSKLSPLNNQMLERAKKSIRYNLLSNIFNLDDHTKI